MLLLVTLGFITLVACVAQVISYSRMRRYVEAELSSQPEPYRPKVSVILPCKGLDEGFESNIQKLLSQDYAASNDPTRTNFEVVFAVAQNDDPAFAALSRLVRENKQVPCKLVVAGSNQARAQKINNQLHALKHISSDSEVLVFVDTDVIAQEDFIQNLVCPLQKPGVGIATGYRFYIPFKSSWPALIRSLWNRLSAWELANHRYAFAWGGAMAIKRSVFEEACVRDHWDRAADDDLSMTTAVKNIGLSVHFVPRCLVASNGDASFAEIIEWMNRQLILTKVYYPALWLKGIVQASLFAVWLVAVFACLVQIIYHPNRECIAALGLGLSILPVEIFFLFQAQGLWKRVLIAPPFLSETTSDKGSAISAAYDRAFFGFLWSLPLAHLLLPWMTLSSLLTNRIQWRGVTYELKGPSEIIVR